MKTERQNVILQLLRDQVIRTQEELAEALKQLGFSVTQATVSRDMKEMHLIKVPAQEGGYRYAEPEKGTVSLNERLTRLLRDCVISAEAAGQLIVVKTMSGGSPGYPGNEGYHGVHCRG